MVKETAVAVQGVMDQALQRKVEFSEAQIQLIKDTVAIGATNNELALYLHQAERTGLDPLSRQIYFIKRKGKGTIQVGIDGFRLIADRTGDYAPGKASEFTFVEKNGKQVIDTCTAFVKKRTKDGVWHEYSATVRWREYVQFKKDTETPAAMWFKMPYGMLEKCAEAKVLRKGFPAELSGIYTNDEMMQADMPEPSGAVGAVAPPPTTQPQAEAVPETVDAEVVDDTPPDSVQYTPPTPPTPAPAPVTPPPAAPPAATPPPVHGSKSDDALVALYSMMNLDIKGTPLQPASEGQKRMVWAKSKAASITKDEINAIGDNILGKPSSNMWYNGDISYFLHFIADPDAIAAQRAMWAGGIGTPPAAAPAATNPPPAAAPPADDGLPF